MEPNNFDPMGSHNSYSGFFESKKCCSNLQFIGGIFYLPNNVSNLKSDDRKIRSKTYMDDRIKRLILSLRFTLAHWFYGRKHSERRVRLGPNHIDRNRSCNQRFNLLLEELLESCSLCQATIRTYIHLKSKEKLIRSSRN